LRENRRAGPAPLGSQASLAELKVAGFSDLLVQCRRILRDLSHEKRALRDHLSIDESLDGVAARAFQLDIGKERHVVRIPIGFDPEC
jgi:hypothetical protein